MYLAYATSVMAHSKTCSPERHGITPIASAPVINYPGPAPLSLPDTEKCRVLRSTLTMSSSRNSVVRASLFAFIYSSWRTRADIRLQCYG
jgi:hypothetical protein